MKTQNNIDKIFKHGLEDPVDEAAFREGDWDALEQMLDKDKKRRPGVIFWLPILSSAAVLLIFLGWWIFRPQVTDHAQKSHQQVAINQTKKTQQQTGDSQAQKSHALNSQSQKEQEQLAAVHQKKTSTVDATGNTTNNKTEKTISGLAQPKVKSAYLAGNLKGNGHAIKNAPVTNQPISTTEKNNGENAPVIAGQNNGDNTRDYAALTAVSATPGITQSNGIGMPVLASIDILPKATTGTANDVGLKSGKSTIRKTGLSSIRPQYGLTVLASSELNGVGSLQKTSAGSNYGVIFSAGVSKFTLSTGVNYTMKPYSLPFSEYHTVYQFKNAPQTVNADCRMLDIPINLDYQVYNKHRNKISVGTGLSSYLMMNEDYTYDYGNTNVVNGPSYYNVKKPGKYLFSIMNLQATYTRQINSKVGISLQPYLKVPLSNVGYSQVKLETFGTAIGLNWNINSLTKPK
jgi:hypothetical protein